MSSLQTFEQILTTLNGFWAEQGCVLLQPYDTEKGAGTM
ncbi:MAG: glycine--tRNA ligase subunit alpha, partial [Cyanobacteria bacterium MAG APA_bin_95]|nr:glycine--tRNA ligase subunit alpha [Cyanobacteria bacterium MAG APA_bin_95]